MKNKIILKELYLQKYSIFGFKILNSWKSIFSAYSFILIEYFITPYFGVENTQIKASILFILIINTSISILIVNSILRIRKVDLYFILLEIPLILYFPFIEYVKS